MKKVTMLLFYLVLLVTLLPTNSLAATLEELPSTESSKHWKVVIAKADDEDPNLNKSKNPELYSVYSMDIKKIGRENPKLVRIEAYRDDPNSTKQYELFTADYPQDEQLDTNFHHHNFPLYTKASKLIVIITWTDKNEESKHPRKFREQFIFEQ